MREIMHVSVRDPAISSPPSLLSSPLVPEKRNLYLETNIKHLLKNKIEKWLPAW
jgi:hypothetical protein